MAITGYITVETDSVMGAGLEYANMHDILALPSRVYNDRKTGYVRSSLFISVLLVGIGENGITISLRAGN